MEKLNTLGEPISKEANQVVEVEFPNGGKRYSYIGGGNLRTGQKVDKAPVHHVKSGKPYTAPVTVVATHNVVGAQVGDKIGVSNGKVKTIPTGLKYLPGAKEYQRDSEININGKKMPVSNYMSEFDKMKKLNSLGNVVGGK